jgi:O-antigen/teichoic acid export membrane protein
VKRRGSPLLGWLTLSGADAVGRVLLQLTSTVLFARMLGPETFGLSALTIVYVGTITTLVSGLFEEALVQRLRVRKAHFAAALATVLALAAGLYALVLLLAATIPDSAVPARQALALASGFGLILFAEGPLSVYTAMARRLRRFPDIAIGNLLGLAVGTAVGLTLAWTGAGVVALLAVPFTARFVNLIVVARRAPVRILPRWNLAPARQLLEFGRWSLGTRYVAGVGEAIFQSLVTRFFGVEGNGFLNMAMRIVEPVRAVTGPIGHNIAMAYFARLQGDATRLSGAVERTIDETSLILQPIFVGLAATAPLILLVIAGPAWTASAPIAVCLALAAAIVSATAFMHNGVLATGRAQVGFGFSIFDVVVTAIAVALLAPLGLIAAGLARLASWALDGVAILYVARRLYGLSPGAVLQAVSSTAICTLLMFGVVVWSIDRMASWPALPRLAGAVVIGIGVYAACVLCLRRHAVMTLIGRLWKPSRVPAAE